MGQLVEGSASGSPEIFFLLVAPSYLLFFFSGAHTQASRVNGQRLRHRAAAPQCQLKLRGDEGAGQASRLGCAVAAAKKNFSSSFFLNHLGSYRAALRTGGLARSSAGSVARDRLLLVGMGDGSRGGSRRGLTTLLSPLPFGWIGTFSPLKIRGLSPLLRQNAPPSAQKYSLAPLSVTPLVFCLPLPFLCLSPPFAPTGPRRCRVSC